MENNPKYSDSVNAMNGCLVGCLRFFWQVFACVLIITLAPYVGILFLIWWPFAWILGLVFPAGNSSHQAYLGGMWSGSSAIPD